MVDPGETDRVPEVATVPILSFREHSLAFVELQLSVEEEPLAIDVGFAVSVAVGVFELMFAVHVALAEPVVVPELASHT